MPDNPDFRLNQLEREVAGVRQRTDDHEKDFEGVRQDIRAFGPLFTDIRLVQASIVDLGNALASVRRDWRADVAHFDQEIVKLRADLEADRRDRDRVRAEREEKERDRERAELVLRAEAQRTERRDKWVRVTTIVALLVAAMSSTAAVITLVL